MDHKPLGIQPPAGKPACQIIPQFPPILKRLCRHMKLADAFFDVFPNITDLVGLRWKDRVLTFEKIEVLALKNDYIDVSISCRCLDSPISNDASEARPKHPCDHIHKQIRQVLQSSLIRNL